MDKREQTRLRVQRYREKAKALQNNSVTGVSVTYHPILYALADPVKRDKLEKICESLGKRKLLGDVYYGCRHPVSFDLVNELLDTTEPDYT